MSDQLLTQAEVARALRAALAEPIHGLPPLEATRWAATRALTIMQIASRLGLDRVADEALECAEFITNHSKAFR